MRYFRATAEVAEAVRQQVAEALGQPNGMANEPWRAGGDFTTAGLAYVSVGPHHTQDEFWQALLGVVVTAGVEEVDEEQYLAARASQEQSQSPLAL
jgi:hypothetical protein